jgi:hypothetical protein
MREVEKKRNAGALTTLTTMGLNVGLTRTGEQGKIEGI